MRQTRRQAGGHRRRGGRRPLALRHRPHLQKKTQSDATGQEQSNRPADGRGGTAGGGGGARWRCDAAPNTKDKAHSQTRRRAGGHRRRGGRRPLALRHRPHLQKKTQSDATGQEQSNRPADGRGGTAGGGGGARWRCDAAPNTKDKAHSQTRRRAGGHRRRGGRRPLALRHRPHLQKKTQSDATGQEQSNRPADGRGGTAGGGGGARWRCDAAPNTTDKAHSQTRRRAGGHRRRGGRRPAAGRHGPQPQDLPARLNHQLRRTPDARPRRHPPRRTAQRHVDAGGHGHATHAPTGDATPCAHECT